MPPISAMGLFGKRVAASLEGMRMIGSAMSNSGRTAPNRDSFAWKLRSRPAPSPASGEK